MHGLMMGFMYFNLKIFFAFSVLILFFSTKIASVTLLSGSVMLSAQPAGVLIAGESPNLICFVITPTESLLNVTVTFSVDERVIASTNISSGRGVYRHTIHNVTTKHSGRYRCAVWQYTDNLKESRHVPIIVTAKNPKAILIVDPSDGLAYSQNPVSMTCSLPKHRGWMFHWYKDGEDLELPAYIRWGNNGRQATYRLWRADPAHNGIYRCRAGRGEPMFYSEYSQPVNINITDLFTSVTLSVTPDVIHKGQSFQLACHVELSRRLGEKIENVQPTFTFLLNGLPMLADSRDEVHTITQSHTTHGGRYSCVAVSQNSRRASQEINVTVKENQTVLIVTHVVASSLLFLAPAVFFICRFIIKRWKSKTTTREFESCFNNLEVVQNVEREPLILSQRELGLNFGLVSSAQQEIFLS